MNIGILAFGFALVFGAVSLIGTAAGEPEPERTEPNYNGIYQAITPKEF